jgi:hypothetical protein
MNNIFPFKPDEILEERWRLTDGGYSMRLTHIPAGLSVMRDYTDQESTHKIRVELYDKLAQKIADKMNTEDKKDWRYVVGAYLQAYWDDVRQHIRSGLTGSEIRFLREYGTYAVWHDYEKKMQTWYDEVGQPPSEEYYEIIQESDHQVLMQVRVPQDISSFKFFSTRFLLIERETGWQIAGIYQPCISCNLIERNKEAPPKTVGTCVLCNGTGKRYTIRRRRFWLFKKHTPGNESCTWCGGKGVCRYCADEEHLGWNRVLSICGIKKTPYKAPVTEG